ncbi:MAG: hypothetical protein HY319_15395 [Armatimonadetes bacterium]|nr:hypothetical protein [Armatimonadota bacterium]
MNQEIYGKIERILREECRVTADIRPESRLAEDLGLDSMGILTLALELENDYRIQLGEDPDDPPQTLAEVVRLVRERLEER